MSTLNNAIHATVYRGGGDLAFKFGATFLGAINVSKALSPTFTFTTENTAQEATVVDHAGWIQRCFGNEARFPGCRRVVNELSRVAHDMTNTSPVNGLYSKSTPAVMTYMPDVQSPTGLPTFLLEDDGVTVAASVQWAINKTEATAILGASVVPDNTILVYQVDVKPVLNVSELYIRVQTDKTGSFPVSRLQLDGVGGGSATPNAVHDIAWMYLGDGWYRLFGLFNMRDGVNDCGLGIGPYGDGSTTYDASVTHREMYVSAQWFHFVGQASSNTEQPSFSDYLDQIYSVLITDGVADGTGRPDGVLYDTLASSFVFNSGTKQLTPQRTTLSDNTVKGILIEPGVTNELTYSQDFSNVAWTNITGTITRAALTSTQSPDRMRTGWTLTPAAAGDTIGQSTAALTATFASASVFLKAGTSTSSQLILYDVTGAAALATVGIAWSSGVPTVSGVAHATAHAYANGWYRICIHGQTITSGNVLSLRIVPDTAGTGTVLAWGAQVEHTTYSATSYIPTTTAVVTRTTDVFTMEKTNITTPQLEQVGSLEAVVAFPDLLSSSGATPEVLIGTAFNAGKSLLGAHNANDMLAGRGSGKMIQAHDSTNSSASVLPPSANISVPIKYRLAYSPARGNMSAKMPGGTLRTVAFDGAFGTSSTAFTFNYSKALPFCVKSFQFWNVDKGQAWVESLP